MTEYTKAGVEELYLVAGNTSDLRVVPERRGAADLLIASAWSPSRLGAAALRLHSEWSAASVPRRPDRDLIDYVARDLPLRNGKPDRIVATRMAMGWYQGELLRIFARLHSLPVVRDQLAARAAQRGIERPESLATEVVCHWLDPICPTCHGLKFLPVQGAPSLSAKACPSCHAHGQSPVPRGQDGHWLLNYLDDCVQKSRSLMRKRLRTMAQIG